MEKFVKSSGAFISATDDGRIRICPYFIYYKAKLKQKNRQMRFGQYQTDSTNPVKRYYNVAHQRSMKMFAVLVTKKKKHVSENLSVQRLNMIQENKEFT